MAEEYNYNYKCGQEWELFNNQECEFV
jgi:hypothetical protein